MKRILSYLLTGMFVLLVLAMPVILVSCSLGDLTENTVVQTLESLDGTYVAQVISSDQGAMGGSTLVEVYPEGKPRQKQRVYMGQWGEHCALDIYWKTDTCLVINGVEYPIE